MAGLGERKGTLGEDCLGQDSWGLGDWQDWERGKGVVKRHVFKLTPAEPDC